jgi:hypothetical protein
MKMARDQWVETLSCPRCGKIGTAELSTADDKSWTIKVDSIPKGFQFIQSEDGSNFYCSFCDRPVDSNTPRRDEAARRNRARAPHRRAGFL